MDKRKESMAEIVAEMRMGSPVNPGAYMIGLPDKTTVLECGDKKRTIQIKTVTVKELADRIEAAAKRKKAQNGNAAAMREALKPWIAFAEWLLENAGKDALGVAIRNNGPIIRQRLEELRAALSAPPRNCDIGTAEEQAERYGRYCDKFTRDGMHCENCPCCGKIPFGNCEFAWAQMPYEAQEGGAE